MLNRWRGGVPLPAWGRRAVVPPFHCSWAAILVALNREMGAPTTASSQLWVISTEGAACWGPGGRPVLTAGEGVIFVLHAGFHYAAASFLLRGGRVEELLEARRHVMMLVALQMVQFVCRRLGGVQVLHRSGVDWAFGSQHASNGRATLPNCACSARLANSRRAAHSMVYLALAGLSEAPHGCQLVGTVEERDTERFQRRTIGTRLYGSGQTQHHRLQRVLARPVKGSVVANDQHLHDGAGTSVANRGRERVVDDHHVAREGTYVGCVEVDVHLNGRVGGADGL